jgi:hypothetical protein
MNTVPADGDVIFQYYLPSGAVLDLQVFFSKNENPNEVLQNLFESENLPCGILPDLERILFDLFTQYRRQYKCKLENSLNSQQP